MWLSNPAASAAFLPAAGSLGGLLLASLGALLVVERGRLRDSVLVRRWLCWALIAPIYLLGVLSGPAVVLLFVSALSLQALREYAALVELPPYYRRALLVAGLLPGAAATLGPEAHAALPTAIVLAATLLPLLDGDVRAGARHAALAVFGWLYLPWLLSYLVLLQRDVPRGPETVLALGLAVALGDVGAYLAGKRFGRRRLAPAVSPNKTWAGVAGSVLGVAVGLVLLRWALAPGLSVPGLVGLTLLVAAGAVWGDLVESLLKRARGVKDAGAWLPGFGGLLDRIDSLVLALPLSYYFLRGVL
jgi:phosphatidate cytidylyltransferase